ncbi:MAG: secretin and TonB N-terminal domain-containing protein [Candidatus Omnitrophica bacterium]|nr:secretin and TonB N-terminal domain-containing protein [Candidatus Omnitrophota bacterium]
MKKGKVSIWTVVFVLFICVSHVMAQVSLQAPVYERYAEADEESTPEAVEGSSQGNVTLDFKDADIINVLRILSLKSGVNIVTGPEVSGSVTIRLTDVPWEQALEVVLRTYGYVYEREENIIRVTTKENLQTEELITEAFVLNYSTAEEIEDAISEIISERGRIKSVPRTNTVIVTDVPTNVYKIREVIGKLDRRTPQVYIDSKIVRTELGITENLGIDWNVAGTLTGAQRPTQFPFTDGRSFSSQWSSVEQILKKYYPYNDSSAEVTAQDGNAVATSSDFPAGFDPTFPNATSSDYTFGSLDFTSFSAVLNMLKSRSSTKIVSNPRIVTLNHKEALVQVGSEIGIPTFERNENSGSFEVAGYESRNVGVVLSVTPHVNDANEILVDLQPEISSFDGFSAIGGTNLSYPSFTTTRAQTQVLIKNTETIAIGGLLTDAESGTYNKVPVLGDIPLVGRIFQSKRQSAGSNAKLETLFFVTCTIVDTQGDPEEFTTSQAVSYEQG